MLLSNLKNPSSKISGNAMIKKLTIILILLISVSTLSWSQKITWKQTDKSLSGNVNIIASQSGAIYAGTVAGVHRTTDGGASWELTNSGLKNTKVYSIGVLNSNDLFCGTLGGIFFSTNKGGSWTEVNNGLKDKFITTINAYKDDAIYAGTLYSGMFFSTNKGGTWSQVRDGLDTNRAVNAVAVRSTGEIYVGTTSGLYRSNSKGKAYQEMKNNMPIGQNVYSIGIRSNGIVFFGTRDGKIWRTTDNGNKWEKMLELQERVQVYSLIVTQNGAIVAGTYGKGIYRSNDNGITWQNINDGLSNLSIMSVTQATTQELYCGTWGSGAFKGQEPAITTVVTGKSFCPGGEISIGYTTNIVYQADNIFTAQLSDSSGNFLKTINIGSIQSTTSGTIIGKIPKSIIPGKNYRIRVVASNPKEEGAGIDSAIVINPLPHVEITGKLEVCENTLEQYYVLNEPGVTTQWVVTGGEIKSASNKDTIDIMWGPSKPATLSVVKMSSITGCLDTMPLQIIIYKAPVKPVITRMGGQLVSSANKGNQWFKFDVKVEGATDKLYDLTEEGLYYVQVTSDQGCISEMSEEFDYNYRSVNDPVSQTIINVSPNPTSGIIRIELQTPNCPETAIEIFDLYGARVMNSNVQSEKTQTTKEIDMSSLTSGTYYIRFTCGKNMFYERVVLTK